MNPEEKNTSSENNENKKTYNIYEPKHHQKFGPFRYILSSFAISSVVITSKFVLQVLNSTKVFLKFINISSSLEKINSMKFSMNILKQIQKKEFSPFPITIPP
jgi:hypothetical protein